MGCGVWEELVIYGVVYDGLEGGCACGGGGGAVGCVVQLNGAGGVVYLEFRGPWHFGDCGWEHVAVWSGVVWEKEFVELGVVVVFGDAGGMLVLNISGLYTLDRFKGLDRTC